MNINSDYSDSPDFNDCPTADQVMSKGMGFIAEKLIAPMEDKLEEDDLKLLALIGMSFQIVAQQASAYEKLQTGEIPPPQNDQDFFRN
jgi:hypothetical protein